jgi:transposase-like protein
VRKDARVKAEVLKLVEHSPLPVRQTLMELEVPPATYYRWRRRHTEKGLEGLRDLPPRARRVWNRLPEEERVFIVGYALEHPSLSPREVSARLVDRERRFVSESTVYRILRQADLLKPPEAQGFPAGKEYKVKTTLPNQLWHITRMTLNRNPAYDS